MVLTKPIGFGVTVTASKVGLAEPDDLQAVINWMKTLNGTASKLAVAAGCQSGTDVTGFSLMGHSWEMLKNSDIIKIGVGRYTSYIWNWEKEQ